MYLSIGTIWTTLSSRRAEGLNSYKFKLIFDLSFSIAFILQKNLHPISLGFSLEHPKYYGHFSHKENLPEEIIEHVPVHATYGTHKQAGEELNS